MRIDLHIHSTASDGTLSPKEIVEEARRRGVGGIAVCDHDVTKGTQAVLLLARAAGLKCVSGVEIDAMLCGQDAHILCYGANLADAALSEIIRDARARLDRMSDDLLVRMLPDYPALSAAEYESLTHDCAQGGWKLLQYLKAKGIIANLREGFVFYDRDHVGYDDAGFRPAQAVIEAIHAAGGCAILAHPGVTFGSGAVDALKQAIEMNIDGAECFYPKHARDLTTALESVCRAKNLSVTAGSDCHGAFGSAAIGETNTQLSQLSLLHPALARAFVENF